MLAVLDPRLNVVRVFDRTVWDSPVLFTEENGRLVDVDTRSTWSYDGTALSGKLKDARLDEFFGMYAFWFAWAAFHPETLLVPGPSVVPDSALVKGCSRRHKHKTCCASAHRNAVQRRAAHKCFNTSTIHELTPGDTMPGVAMYPLRFCCQPHGGEVQVAFRLPVVQHKKNRG